MADRKLTPKEVAQIAQDEVDSVRIQQGVDKVKEGFKDIRRGLWGEPKKGR